ncbi:TIGR04554 family membrane protein [Mycoplasmopsis bovis]|uniref:Uncharacterized protein n=2 Tax=Mycoplasmopsis bovis TaxID=28903 RepID=A0A2N8U1N1_MYCBV|nr:TIGR04554 family membrane protein [Mycoplasmopsis bovis]AEI89865.1 conserved hypothetical protein [Mycoplasmopsis bovis Hubei-1]AFM51532.1 putative transmembrane protein [Mycoplasmopsis bovis HB0801]AIA33743.1 hypothetical protein K668_00765 [Mycoplasmopsis bovis CQ-W70]AKO50383.1 membrane protein [Mycoplasmopsis bovis]AQU85472.1 hypothetical protein B0W43_00830 [Mycoplasmopsis bovis]
MSKLLSSSVLSGSSISTVAGNGMTALGAVGLVLALLSVILLTVVVLKFKDRFSNKVNIAFPAAGYLLGLLGIILAAVAISKNVNPGLGDLASDPVVVIKGTAASGLVFGVLSAVVTIVAFIKFKKQQ